MRQRTSALQLPGRISETGYLPPARLSLEAWLAVCGRVGRLGQSMTWALGDLLVYGETHYAERYAQVEAILSPMGYAPETLRKLQWLAERVPPERRRRELSAAHHAEVASLEPPEQSRLLAHAEQGNLTRAELRELVQTARGTAAVARKVCTCCADGCADPHCRCYRGDA